MPPHMGMNATGGKRPTNHGTATGSQTQRHEYRKPDRQMFRQIELERERRLGEEAVVTRVLKD